MDDTKNTNNVIDDSSPPTSVSTEFNLHRFRKLSGFEKVEVMRYLQRTRRIKEAFAAYQFISANPVLAERYQIGFLNFILLIVRVLMTHYVWN